MIAPGPTLSNRPNPLPTQIRLDPMILLQPLYRSRRLGRAPATPNGSRPAQSTRSTAIPVDRSSGSPRRLSVPRDDASTVIASEAWQSSACRVVRRIQGNTKSPAPPLLSQDLNQEWVRAGSGLPGVLANLLPTLVA